LSEAETVRGIILRGDLVSPHRWVAPESGIDLLVLVDFEQTDVALRVLGAAGLSRAGADGFYRD